MPAVFSGITSPWRSLPVKCHASALIFAGGLESQAATPRLGSRKRVANALALATDPVLSREVKSVSDAIIRMFAAYLLAHHHASWR